MDYLSIEEAKTKSGLRLVLSAGVPGPWGESAKALFRHHDVAFHPVRQEGGQDNPELVAWTKHRNAPVAVYDDEAPRVRWLELLDLAERLGSGPSLVPSDRAERMFMIGLINEIAGENGFAWNARLLMLNPIYQAVGDEAYKNPMVKDYQFDPEKIDSVKNTMNEFLTFLGKHIEQQPGQYLVGNQFSAADIYWAYFSNLLSTLDPSINPMPSFLRKNYDLVATFLEPFDSSIIEQRDATIETHLETPLDF